MRRATSSRSSNSNAFGISIHALLAESDASRFHLRATFSISIHALLAESDCSICASFPQAGDFYPRSPCGERRALRDKAHIAVRFLSTLSLRRATISTIRITRKTTDFYPRSPCGERHRYKQHRLQCNFNFYPRSPCGERPYQRKIDKQSSSISIHALLAESDRRGAVPVILII